MSSWPTYYQPRKTYNLTQEIWIARKALEPTFERHEIVFASNRPALYYCTVRTYVPSSAEFEHFHKIWLLANGGLWKEGGMGEAIHSERCRGVPGALSWYGTHLPQIGP